MVIKIYLTSYLEDLQVTLIDIFSIISVHSE